MAHERGAEVDVEAMFDSEDAFWDELDDVVATPCRSHDRIDDTLRTWLELGTRARWGIGERSKEVFLQTEEDVERCARALLESDLYEKHTEYVRTQLVYALLQEEDPPCLHVISTFLLSDGMENESTFEIMSREGAFSQLVELIRDGKDDGLGLHKRLLDLLYEMSRVQRLRWEHLSTVDDDFVLYLLRIIEGLSYDASDPYHYPVIRVLLVLNEQYMVLAHNPTLSKSTGAPITNRVIKVLSMHGAMYKTFGENIILLINRESETSLQLLILKVLYLLFTTPSTREYFYTNDLHVLVDILIRNLLDLPSEYNPPSTSGKDSNPSSPRTGKSTSSTSSLRHTYLRVLHPLLAHTQLRLPPHYKRDQLRRTLFLLADATHSHFDRPDETTIRLVGRCISVDWLKDDDDAQTENDPSTQNTLDTPELMITPSSAPSSGASTPKRKAKPPRPPDRNSDKHVVAGQAVVAKRLMGLGMQLPEARESSISVAEVAAQTAEPGVKTPSRANTEREVALTMESSDEIAERTEEVMQHRKALRRDRSPSEVWADLRDQYKDKTPNPFSED